MTNNTTASTTEVTVIVEGIGDDVDLETRKQKSCCPSCCPSFICKAFCSCNCCEDNEIKSARKDLMGIIMDWLTDAGVATFHILLKNRIAGILTYAIVFFAGVVITFTNFCPRNGQYRNDVKLVRSEIWKMGKVYGVIMYIPSFFPICSAKLRLQHAKQMKVFIQRHSKEKTSEVVDEINEMKRKMKIFKEKALWDNCCEAFFEGFPQAVLQLVLILLYPKQIWEYIPITTVFLGLYGITGAPISVIMARDEKMKWNILQKLAAYASNALRVLSSALFILSVLTFAEQRQEGQSYWIVAFWIAFASTIIFSFMAGLYIFQFEINKCFIRTSDPPTATIKNQEEEANINGIHAMEVEVVNGETETQLSSSPLRRKCPETFISMLGLLLTMLSLYLWISSQLFRDKTMAFSTVIMICLYTVLMLLTCVGLLFSRDKLALYQSVTADVPVSAYLGVKQFIVGITKKMLCL